MAAKSAGTERGGSARNGGGQLLKGAEGSSWGSGRDRAVQSAGT